MKTTTLITLITYLVSQTMLEYFMEKDKMAEAGIMAGVFIMAYLFAEIIFRDGFQKKDLSLALFFGIFVGSVSQIIQFYSTWSPAIINIVSVVFCMFPAQIKNILLSVFEKYLNKKI